MPKYDSPLADEKRRLRSNSSLLKRLSETSRRASRLHRRRALPMVPRRNIGRRAFLAVIATALLFAIFGTWRDRAAAQTTTGCPAWHAKLDRSVHHSLHQGTTGRIPVIVRAASTSRTLWREALVNHGDPVRRDLAGVGAFGAEVHLADVNILGSDPSVRSISLDSIVGAHQSTAGTYVHPEVLLGTLGLGENSDWDGDGVGIAVVDSGIERSSDFEDRITAFYDFTAGGISRTPYDDYGHGTHVAGTIAGAGKMSRTNAFAGVASKARLIGMKVLDSRGSGRTSDVIAAIEYAVLNRVRLGIDIINLSLGHPIYESAATDPLVQAVESAVRSKMIVVLPSAGNYGIDPTTGRAGYGGITSPGNAPLAITVGAFDPKGTVTRRNDTIAGLPSRGPTWYDAFAKPDVIAPGHRLAANAARAGPLICRISGPSACGSTARTITGSAERAWPRQSPQASWPRCSKRIVRPMTAASGRTVPGIALGGQ